MNLPCKAAAVSALAILGASLALAADAHKQTFNIAPSGTMSVINNAGSVVLRPASGRQASVSYTTFSDKVEADCSSTRDGRRVEVRTHALAGQKPTPEESRVDYEIAVPSGVSVNISTSTASITIENLSGDFSLSSDTGQITVNGVTNSFVHVHSLTAPVTLSNLSGVHAEIMSTGGNVQMNSVTGPKVNVSTTGGDISYKGDFSGGGIYTLITHDGTISVSLPETASVDLSARSISGSVENDFPLRDKPHTTFSPIQGRSFAGTSHTGSSSVELQSFSGRIRVKMQ
ncbi:MAG TPA: DUF4097 family beta strand repeat-containing protein [Candidatus Angelobacter sp.]|nr:DUF4097 family beta strand repeat-containing protein [Candidatus Angelobacter sp.]